MTVVLNTPPSQARDRLAIGLPGSGSHSFIRYVFRLCHCGQVTLISLCEKWSIIDLDLIMVLKAIFTLEGNTRQKLQCLYGNLMANMNSELF